MVLMTKNFGEIQVKEEDIIYFHDGIPGFENLCQYIMIENPDKEVPFHWLQSVEDTDLAFVIINPFIFKKNYDFQLPQNIIEKLEITSPEDVMVFSIVVIPDDVSKMTANLRAPIIINHKKRKGKQTLLENEAYHTKHYILDEIEQVG